MTARQVTARQVTATAEKLCEWLFATLRQLRAASPELDSEAELYAAACRALIDHGRFRFAWIGIVDRTRGVVVPAATAGEPARYLEGIEVRCDDSVAGRGPTGTAIRERRRVVCSDIEQDPAMAPWRARALAHGFRSSGAFPIVRGGSVVGALSLYRATRGFASLLEELLTESVADEIGLCLDAIDRERARRESEHLLRGIFEATRDGVFVADADGRYLTANPAGCRMFGYELDELRTIRLHDLIAPEDLAARPVELERFQAGEGFVTERRMVRKDGSRIMIEIHGVRLPGGRVQSIVHDITARRRLELEQAATDRLLVLGRLAQSVAHEINNPLAYVALNLDRLRGQLAAVVGDQHPELERVLAEAADGMARVGHVVRALSGFGRGDAGAVTGVEVEPVVHAALALTQNRIEHLATVEVALARTPPVLANEFGLAQVLVNLLLNAADALEAAATRHRAITIRSSPTEDGRVVITVEDNGPGIPEALWERIFEPAFTTKPIGKGMGLGLAISRNLITGFGGALEARARSGGGAVFEVSLPAASAAPPARDAAAAAPATLDTRSRGLRILVVDDEPLVARALAHSLEEHEVVVCHDVASALEHCRRTRFDCVMCDVMMPGGGGRELHEALSREQPGLAARVVFITGGTFTDASRAFVERVGNACVFKPFDLAQLRRTVEAVARPAPAQPTSATT